MTTVQEIKSMAEKILAFQENGEGYDLIISELSWKAYNFPKKKRVMDEDDCAEFFLFVCPTIKRIPKSYIAGKVPFDAYFHTLLRLKFKTYLDRKMNRPGVFERSVAKEFDETSPETAAEFGPVYRTNPDEIEATYESSHVQSESERKQVLFLALKYALHLDPLHIEKLHRLTGFGEDRLFEALEDAKVRLERKLARLASFSARRDRLYYTIGVLRSKLASVRVHDGDRTPIYEQKLKRLELRHRLVLQTISKINTTVSNKEIAEITGFPKGTIDTSLRRLKNKSDQNKQVIPAVRETTPANGTNNRCA